MKSAGSPNTAALIFAGLFFSLALPVNAEESLGFDLSITLTAKAAARLQSPKEGMTVFASYYGDPKPGAEKYADEVGQINLGAEEVNIPGTPGHARVSGTKVDAKRLKWLAGPVMVNVNVASSRKGSPDNLLACDFIDGEVTAVKKAPLTLLCGPIGERSETTMKP